jgi:hypothetical protein
MTYTITAQHILNEIEFELAQGAISKDDLGRAIQEVKQYQSKLRDEVFQPGQDLPQMREIIGRQFQMNDMLITMLQETAAAMHEMELKTKRLQNWQQTAVLPETSDTIIFSLPPDDSIWRETDEVESAMEDPLSIQLEAQPTSIPIVGHFLQRLKYSVHELVLFYLQKFAQKQTAVNRIYGRWILHFDALHHLHQNEIHQLQTQINALKAQLDAADDSPSD